MVYILRVLFSICDEVYLEQAKFLNTIVQQL